MDFLKIYNKEENTLKEMRDIFRQLKFVMDKNGNYIEGNRYFEKEMQYQKEHLKEKKDMINFYILKIQELIRSYGNNWKKIFLCIIIFSIFFNIINFIYVLIYGGKFDLILNQINLLSPFFGLTKDYYDYIKDDKILYFLFIIYKIFYGILIYLLIVSLKRQTKR